VFDGRYAQPFVTLGELIVGRAPQIRLTWRWPSMSADREPDPSDGLKTFGVFVQARTAGTTPASTAPSGSLSCRTDGVTPARRGRKEAV
jgi:hypothetical protein